MRRLLLFFVCVMFVVAHSRGQNVGVGTLSPANSAVLEIADTARGFLLPRLTTSQRNIIPSPDTGLLIYNTTTNMINYYRGDGWYTLTDSLTTTTTGTGSQTGGVVIGANDTLPHPSARLEVIDTSRGVLIPRSDPSNIMSPVAGIVIYHPVNNEFQYYDGGAWHPLCREFESASTGGGSQPQIGVGINTGGPPESSAILELQSTDKGLLLPRLTAQQRNSIPTPASGLVIYNATQKSLDYYNGTAWRTVMSGSPPPPDSVGGLSQPCNNASGIVYGVPVVPGATGYTWTVPAGASITNGQGTDTITVDWGTNSGDVCARALNSCDTSTSTCLTVTLQSSPSSPTVNSPSSIMKTSFDANWSSVSGATTYYLDVATDSNFTSYVSGYNNLDVGNVTSYTVSGGLTCNTLYYYRVRARNACGTSNHSDTLEMATACCPELEDYEDGSIADWTQVNDMVKNVATDRVYSGTYSGKWDVPPDDNDGSGSATKSVTPSSHTEYGFYLQQDNDIYDDMTLGFIDNGGGTFFRVNVNRETTQNLHIYTPVSNINTGVGFPSDVWVHCRVYNIDWSAQTYDYELVRTDNNNVIVSGSENFSSSSVTEVDELNISVAEDANNSWFWVDDWYCQ